MNAKDAIESSAKLSALVLKTYLSDLDDADLLRRPADSCNHIAWQLGHLISSEVMLLEQVSPGHGVTLPDGFADAHGKSAADNDDPNNFHSKADYLELFDQVHNASMAALRAFPDEDLDKPAPENFRSFCPTNGDMFNLIASHPMMHAGQFVIVRRQLGKPILM